MMNRNFKKVLTGAVVVGVVVAGVMNSSKISYAAEVISDKVETGIEYVSEVLGIDPEIEAENIRYGFETAETEDGYAEGRQFGIFDMSVNDKDLYIDADFSNVEYKLGDVEIVEKDGIVNIEVKIIKLEELKEESEPLKINKTFENSIKTVYLGGDILYDGGVCIGEDAASMYKYKLESVSEVDKVQKLVYGVTVGQREAFSIYNVDVKGKDIQVRVMNSKDDVEIIKMEKSTPLILALAKDAESVTWFDKNGNLIHKLTLQEIGQSIKEAGESASALQKYITDENIGPYLSY
jgi:hypothetical protein